MAEVLEVNTGICSTCNYLVDCPQRLRTENPIWFCENYDDSDGRASANNPGFNIAIPDYEVRGENSCLGLSTPVSLGLCVNCAQRDDCRLPHQEGGVWHCEEFS